ncbi:vitamin B12-dependent ribonucleotide reductase [Candidatus Woesearchaeota archaeon]|nr:vitamin B12-dependent ribonucleotide reductase [Candidatus Woesearchaeota archaeon]
MLNKIQKRDGRFVKFEPEKITNAIYKAAFSVGFSDKRVCEKLSGQVVRTLETRFPKITPTVEDVQDLVEKILIKNSYAAIAKAYILYREKRTELRETKTFFGIRDDLKLELNAINVLKRRYLLKNEQGKVIETPRQMFQRVAEAVGRADLFYYKKADLKKIEKQFFEAMINLEFLPNSPTLMNAGTKLGQLSACFVIPVEDSIESIFGAVKQMAIIHKSGGGTGFSFSKLRPAGDIVMSTKGTASGPVSFMTVFDTATNVIKQGGKRRGANMGILRADHPDIFEFITSKSSPDYLTNFNISVAADDKFMDAVINNKEYDLINPRTKKRQRTVSARDIFDLIVTMNWRTGDPGLVFIDEINRKHVLKKVGKIESTNPCGEAPLFAYESCNLGSINLSKMAKDKRIDWQKLRKTIHLGIHFLDNVIDINKYPIQQIAKITKSNRKIGLGVMGFAELLIKLEIPYDSRQALKLAEKIMKFITNEARKKSAELARKRGSFPNFAKSNFHKKMRNATVTTIAPTGTISIISNTSSGIEPLFAVSFIRNVMEGAKLLEVNKLFEETAKKHNFYSKKLMMKIARHGSVQKIQEVPKNIKRIFKTAHDISPEWHVRMQAAFQKHTDNAVSKTINMPHELRPEDIRKAFMLAYKLKCKGITVYRYGSKIEQVLYLGTRHEGEEHVRAESEYAGGCPAVYCPY